MKNILIIAALMLPSMAFAASEETCLRYAALGGKIAEGRAFLSDGEIGEFLGELHQKNIRQAKNSSERRAASMMYNAQIKMLAFVSTMRLGPDDARELIYLKCKVGEYD